MVRWSSETHDDNNQCQDTMCFNCSIVRLKITLNTVKNGGPHSSSHILVSGSGGPKFAPSIIPCKVD